MHCKIVVAFLAILSVAFAQEEGEKVFAKDDGSPDDEARGLVIDPTFVPDKCEKKSKKGDMLKMHYTGSLAVDGTVFDSSVERKEPFDFQIGAGQVIQGWELGLLDMCIGEKRTLTIPAHLGYGEAGAGEKIPPGSTLKFDVELMGIEDGPKQKNVFKEIDANGDNKLSKDEVRNFSIQLLKEVRELYAGLPEDFEFPEGSGYEGAKVPQLPDDYEEKFLEQADEIWVYEDLDQDGMLTFDEFTGLKHYCLNWYAMSEAEDTSKCESFGVVKEEFRDQDVQLPGYSKGNINSPNLKEEL